MLGSEILLAFFIFERRGSKSVKYESGFYALTLNSEAVCSKFYCYHKDQGFPVKPYM